MKERIKQKKFRSGTLLWSAFPAGGSVSLVGSVALPQSPGEDELADVHASMLLEGTVARDKRALQAALDEIGASLSFSSQHNRLRFDARVRVVHLKTLLGIIEEVLHEPKFGQDELSVLKKRELANLSHAAQDTYTQAQGALSRILFPSTHPNYQAPTKEHERSLKSLSRSALVAFHRRLSADTLVLSASGDVKAEEFFRAAQIFSSLPHKKVTNKKIAPAKTSVGTKVVNIKNKASVDYMAGVATRINNTHKDYPALLLGLQVLGNRTGFTGRLMQIVREEKGLTYGVYALPSGFTGDIDGSATVWATFAPQLFENGRSAVLEEINRIVRDGAEKDEVRKHAELFYAKARVNISTSGAWARAAHDTTVDRKPLSYLDDFPKKVRALTEREVNAALKKYLDPKKLSEAAAGPVERL